jgi:hypothetical protein
LHQKMLHLVSGSTNGLSAARKPTGTFLARLLLVARGRCVP